MLLRGTKRKIRGRGFSPPTPDLCYAQNAVAAQPLKLWLGWPSSRMSPVRYSHLAATCPMTSIPEHVLSWITENYATSSSVVRSGLSWSELRKTCDVHLSFQRLPDRRIGSTSFPFAPKSNLPCATAKFCVPAIHRGCGVPPQSVFGASRAGLSTTPATKHRHRNEPAPQAKRASPIHHTIRNNDPISSRYLNTRTDSTHGMS